MIELNEHIDDPDFAEKVRPVFNDIMKKLSRLIYALIRASCQEKDCNHFNGLFF